MPSAECAECIEQDEDENVRRSDTRRVLRLTPAHDDPSLPPRVILDASPLRRRDLDEAVPALARAVASQTQALLAARGVAAQVLSEEVEACDVKTRANQARQVKPDVYLSLHIGQSDASHRHGVETLVHSDAKERSEALCRAVHDRVSEVLIQSDRNKTAVKGVRRAEINALRPRYHALTTAPVRHEITLPAQIPPSPAVILSIAKALAHAIDTYLEALAQVPEMAIVSSIEEGPELYAHTDLARDAMTESAAEDVSLFDIESGGCAAALAEGRVLADEEDVSTLSAAQTEWLRDLAEQMNA